MLTRISNPVSNVAIKRVNELGSRLKRNVGLVQNVASGKQLTRRKGGEGFRQFEVLSDREGQARVVEAGVAK